MKIRPLGVELFHVDRQTDMTKLTVAFSNFVNAPKCQRTQQMCLLLIFIITIIIVTVAYKTC
jgi:t-SNARE complex subunit (syntaxin)